MGGIALGLYVCAATMRSTVCEGPTGRSDVVGVREECEECVYAFAAVSLGQWSWKEVRQTYKAVASA